MGGARDGVVIEDDYDAEFRYDRPPLGALQGLAPDRVVYMGTASKTLAPALRLGWLVLPRALVEPVVDQKALADHGCPTLDQLALARMIDSGASIGTCARLAAAIARGVTRWWRPSLAISRAPASRAWRRACTPSSAWPRPVDGLAMMAAAAAVGRRVRARLLLPGRSARHDGLILGYANLAEAAIEEGVRRLALRARGAARRGDAGAHERRRGDPR